MFSQLSPALSLHSPQFASVPTKMKIKGPPASRSTFRTKRNICPLSTVQTLQGVTAHSSSNLEAVPLLKPAKPSPHLLKQQTACSSYFNSKCC